MNDQPTRLGEWLSEVCQKQGLSLREAAVKTGLSHATIRDIMNGTQPSPESIRKLSQAFGGDGAHQKLALEDHLLVLAGYRTPRDGQELSQPLARLIDSLSEFSEPQLKIMGRFADFLAEMEKK